MICYYLMMVNIDMYEIVWWVLNVTGMDEPLPDQIRETFYLYRRLPWETLGEFLVHYHRLFLAARSPEVTDVDGIFHLLFVLPVEWREWAITLVPEFVDQPLISEALYGDCNGFIAKLTYQYLTEEVPPPGPHIMPVRYLALRAALDPVFRDNPILFPEESLFGDNDVGGEAVVPDLENEPNPELGNNGDSRTSNVVPLAQISSPNVQTPLEEGSWDGAAVDDELDGGTSDPEIEENEDDEEGEEEEEDPDEEDPEEEPEEEDEEGEDDEPTSKRSRHD